MQRVGEFEKVSFEQFRDAMKDEFYRGQELPPAIEDDLKKMWEEIALPSRATTGSAGYDFKAPFTFEMRPGETMKIPTGIRVKIDEGWWLGCLPRSGLGFKFRMQFDNTMGVIDSDYYFSDNEGHIFAKITNDSKSQKIVHVEAGNGFMQAIFIPYGITYSDDATGVRNGLGLCDVLAVVFIVLKLIGVIDWSWWWVLAPVWIPVIIVVIAYIVISIVD